MAWPKKQIKIASTVSMPKIELPKQDRSPFSPHAANIPSLPNKASPMGLKNTYSDVSSKAPKFPRLKKFLVKG